MLKKEYHCLVAGLPDLFFNENKPGIDSLNFRQQLKAELSLADFELVKLIYLVHDNENLINLFLDRNKPFNPKGNFTEQYLQQQLSPGDEPPELPDYMLQFLEWMKETETKELNLDAEIVMQQLYYEYILQVNNEFLRDCFLFQLNLKNILTAVSCIKFGYNVDENLIRTPENKNVCSLLISKKLKPELFEDEVPFYKEIFKITESDFDWIEREKAVDTLKWDYLDENTFFHYFTIEKILGYISRLKIVERWMQLDKKTGEELLGKLINDFDKSTEFSAEYGLTR